MTYAGRGGDEYEAFDRPGRRSNRPRTKDRPDYTDAESGMVITVDRGRYRVLISAQEVIATKARQLGRKGVIVGDRVRVGGDTSGGEGTLAASSGSKTVRPYCGVRLTMTTRTSALSWPMPTSSSLSPPSRIRRHVSE